MALTYFGFAVADGMFGEGDTLIHRIPITAQEAHDLILEARATGVFRPCLNPSHLSTIQAMEQRFGIYVPIPETPPKIQLKGGDCLIVMSVRGLPRLTENREYTQEEVDRAQFAFSKYLILDVA